MFLPVTRIPLLSRSVIANNSVVTRQRVARNVKNLDYKNASSWTVTNSRTFLNLQITRIFMRARGRTLALEHATLGERLRPYGGIFVGTNRARNACAIAFAQRALGFPEVFLTGAITEFIRAGKIRASVSEVTCKVSPKFYYSNFNDFLIRRNISLTKDITEERIFNI